LSDDSSRDAPPGRFGPPDGTSSPAGCPSEARKTFAKLSPERIPTVVAPPREVPGMAISPVRENPVIAIARWQCHGTRSGFNAENSQAAPTLAFIHAGAFVHRDARGTALIDANGVAFFNAGAPYQTAHPAGFHDRGVFFVVRADVMREILQSHQIREEGHSSPYFRNQAATISGSTYLRERDLVHRMSHDPDTEPLEWEEKALRLTSQVLAETRSDRVRRSPARARTRARWRDAIEATKGFLASNLGESHRIEKIARTSGLSPYHLCRLFRNETGITIHSYLNRLRLRSALHQLDLRRRDLSALAADLGFSSHSHMTAAFRREFGVTPSVALDGRLDP
jgi:AraC family transcriptional regulator